MTLRILFFALTLFVTSLTQAAQNTSCDDLLQVIPGDYMSYVQQVESRLGDSRERQPGFLNPDREKELAKLWAGELGPKALQKFLPEGVTFVSHQLRKASAPGVVKVEQKSGDFLILRVEMEFDGKMIGTNVTVNAQALYQNIYRSFNGEPLWLIGPDATAAMDWGHGGGTKTTGGHTADTLMNYMAKYNVFTFGMDQPWHGEGPREWFENERDYFRFRVAFRNKFVHPNVPTFLIGHSKGGLVADMALRRTGPEFKDIGLDKAYAGMVSLSFVPDPKPGGTYLDKTTQERIKDMEQKEEHVSTWMNPGDRSLFANLMAQDKVSPLSGFFCSILSMANCWNENEKVSLPSLYIMGEHDALYLLSEKSIEQHIRSLDQATLWTFSSRVSFRGDLEPVGHMIFDHYIPKKDHPEALEVMTGFLKQKFPNDEIPSDQDEVVEMWKSKVLQGHLRPHMEYSYLTPVNNYPSTLVLVGYQWIPEVKSFIDQRISGQSQAKYFLEYTDKEVFETYQVIKDFVAKTLQAKGVELNEVTAKHRLEKAQGEGDILANQRESILSFLKTYGNNLAFREFLKDFSYHDTGATKDFENLNRISSILTQRMKMILAIKKEKISEEEKQAKIAQLEPVIDDLGTWLSGDDVQSIQLAMDRIQKIRNKVWIPDGDLKQFAEENVRVRNETVKKVKALEVQRDHLKKELEGLKKQLTQLENAFEDATLGAQSEAISAYETRRAKLYSELETYDLKVRDVQEAFLVNLLKEGKSLSEAFNHLPEDLLASYQESERASKDYQQVLSEGQALIESEAASGALGANAKSLYEQVQRAKQNYAARAYEYAHLEYVEVTQARDAQDLLLADYVELVMPQYFTITQVKVGELLDQPMNSLEDFRDALKAAEKALSQWRGKVLTSKPEGQDSSLY